MTMNECSVLCIGELVWDLLPEGWRLGGAPFHVAVQLARQGLQVALLTAVGHDGPGNEALSFLRKEGIRGALLHPRLPTGTVKVDLDSDGVPQFKIHHHHAWTDISGAYLSGVPTLVECLELPALAVIVFGGLAMHSRSNRLLLEKFLREFPKRGLPTPRRVCDLNLRPGWSDPEVVRWCAQQADILKVSEAELQLLRSLDGEAHPKADHDLFQRYALQGLCTTRGPEGLRWMGPDGENLEFPARCGGSLPLGIEPVGGGSVLTASIAQGLVRREPAEVFLERGWRWAAELQNRSGSWPYPAVLEVSAWMA
jgi:fructokinase